ncbi:MAG: transposase [Oligoflexia bacterium]|nr:transposase [Oligoflexia bacterium]
MLQVIAKSIVFLGREKYVREQEEDPNYRNGSYVKNYTVKNVGKIKVEVPRDRKGEFKSKLVKKYERTDGRIEKDLAMLFLSGLSTRNLSMLSKSLIGKSISAGEISRVNQELFNVNFLKLITAIISLIVNALKLLEFFYLIISRNGERTKLLPVK